MASPDSVQPLRVLVAGSGVAALEAVLALRALASERVALELLAPASEFVDRPSSVLTPFSGEPPRRLRLEHLEALGVTLHRGALAGVDARRHLVGTTGGAALSYDRLLVAVGARSYEAVDGAVTFRGPLSAGSVEGALRRAAREPDARVIFTAPAGANWVLPLYELALLAARELGDGPELRVVTPESRPLELFGAVASDAVARLLDRAGVGWEGGLRPAAFLDRALLVDDGGLIPADLVIALPKLIGPRLAGLPHDDEGFIPVDRHGRVDGCEHVYAAGDVTAGPIKQGGLATQQADAAAEAIAAEAGARVRPKPYRPVLRGLMLTGDAPLYLRAELDGSAPIARPLAGAAGLVSRSSLWWPPGKVAGRHLTGFLAARGRPGERLADWAPHPHAGDERAATYELMVSLAAEDAALGDYRQALDALEAAAALGGGVLTPEHEAWRADWERRLEPATVHST